MPIIDELAADGERQAGAGDQLGLQNLMVVVGDVPVRLAQAVRAVPPPEGDVAGAVEHHYERPQQAGLIQDLVADELADHARPQAAQRGRADVAQEVCQRPPDG